jgi:succinoglycan biosynthesis transport protein ExoP
LTTGIHNLGPAQPQEEMHLSEYWAVVVKHRRLIVLCLATALVVGAVISLLSRPSYKATAVLNIEREKSSPFDIGSTPQYAAFDPEFLPTQTRLMRSREVAERVVSRLNLTGNAEVLPPKSGFFKRAPAPAAATLHSMAAGAIQGGITTTPIRGTTLVELSYVATTPRLAAEIANATAEAYVDWSLEAKFQILGQASRFIGAQIEQLRSEVAEREKQLQAYARREDIISVDPNTNVTLQKLESLNRDYASAVADRVAKEARYYEMQSARPAAIAETLSGGLVSQLRNEQSKMEREYADKLNVYKPDWPAMQQLKSQIDKGRQNLDSAVQETVSKAREVARSDYLTALRREQSLKAVLQGQKDEAMTLNSNAVEYNNLKTEVETKRALLDTLLKRQAETEVTTRLRGQRVSNVRIVDRALPPNYRFRPSYRRNGMTSLMFGLGIGIGLAFLLEYLDRSLRSTEQVEQHLRLPALGIVPTAGAGGVAYAYSDGTYSLRLPRWKKSRRAARPRNAVVAVELMPHTHPRSAVAEAYRGFSASLLLSRAGGVKTLAITSVLPGEGKTSTAVNLAVVLGQLGKRVLVVDGDLHKPRLHELFRVSNRVGLVSILAEGAAASDAVIKTTIPGVFVVPAGPNSPNPSGLLSSAGMANFLDYARTTFDFVIVDTPPVSPVADAILLGHQTDGVVLCVKGGETPREQVARVRDKLIRSNVRILGVLINNLTEDPAAYGKYFYGQYYAGAKAYVENSATSRAAS